MLKLVASEVGKSSRLGDIHDSVYNHVIVLIEALNCIDSGITSTQYYMM